MTTIAVTGSTGHIGGAVAGLLADAGVEQTLLVRDPARAPELPRAQVQQSAYGDTDEARAALAGTDVLFLVSASESPTRRVDQLGYVAAAADAGVQHTIYLSFLNAGPEATFTLARDHYATEQALRQSGMSFTFLRDSFYADVLPHFVDTDGVLRGPAGAGRVSAVARRDVAEVAAAVLRDHTTYTGQTLNLTGPEALTLQDVAEVLTRRWGRQVRYHDETVEEARRSRSRWNPEPWRLDAWISTYTAIAAGEVADVSEDLPRVLGRPATSFEQVPLP